MRDITYPPIILTAKLGFRALGQTFQMSGTEHVPRTGGVLLAVNHIGYVDFIYGGLAANPSGRKVRFMAKRELFDHKLAGPLMRSLHHIEVDRGAGTQSMATALEYLKAGEAVGIFPEATISRSFELKEFKSRRGAHRRRGRRAAGAGDPLGHPADDDQGPRARLLPRQDDRGARRARRCTPPARTRPPRPPTCTGSCRPCSTRRSAPTPPRSSPPGSWWLPASYGGSAPDARGGRAPRRRGEARAGGPARGRAKRAEQVDAVST